MFTTVWKHAKIEFEKLYSIHDQKFGKLFPLDKQWLNKSDFIFNIVEILNRIFILFFGMTQILKKKNLFLKDTLFI